MVNNTGTGSIPLNKTLPTREGGARGLMMADYAPDVWDKMPLSERVKYVFEREKETQRQGKEDEWANLPLDERARRVMEDDMDGTRGAAAGRGGGAMSWSESKPRTWPGLKKKIAARKAKREERVW